MKVHTIESLSNDPVYRGGFITGLLVGIFTVAMDDSVQMKRSAIEMGF